MPPEQHQEPPSIAEHIEWKHEIKTEKDNSITYEIKYSRQPQEDGIFTVTSKSTSTQKEELEHWKKDEDENFFSTKNILRLSHQIIENFLKNPNAEDKKTALITHIGGKIKEYETQQAADDETSVENSAPIENYEDYLINTANSLLEQSSIQNQNIISQEVIEYFFLREIKDSNNPLPENEKQEAVDSFDTRKAENSLVNLSSLTNITDETEKHKIYQIFSNAQSKLTFVNTSRLLSDSNNFNQSGEHLKTFTAQMISLFKDKKNLDEVKDLAREKLEKNINLKKFKNLVKAENLIDEKRSEKKETKNGSTFETASFFSMFLNLFKQENSMFTSFFFNKSAHEQNNEKKSGFFSKLSSFKLPRFDNLFSSLWSKPTTVASTSASQPGRQVGN